MLLHYVNVYSLVINIIFLFKQLFFKRELNHEKFVRLL